MSQQFGLMLSLVFLAFFVSFSGELLAFQKAASKFNQEYMQVVTFLQSQGNTSEVDYFEIVYEFDYFSISETQIDDLPVYNLVIYKQYHSKSQLFSFFNKTMSCDLYVYRKVVI